MKIKTVSCRLEVKVQPAPFSSLGASWSIEIEPETELTNVQLEEAQKIVSTSVELMLLQETQKFFGVSARNKVEQEIKNWRNK